MELTISERKKMAQAKLDDAQRELNLLKNVLNSSQKNDFIDYLIESGFIKTSAGNNAIYFFKKMNVNGYDFELKTSIDDRETEFEINIWYDNPTDINCSDDKISNYYTDDFEEAKNHLENLTFKTATVKVFTTYRAFIGTTTNEVIDEDTLDRDLYLDLGTSEYEFLPD